MKDEKKTREQLIAELSQAQQEIAELERLITESNLVKKALQESEEKYRLLVDNSDIPITYFTTDGYVLLINKMGAMNLGGRASDFAGRHIHQVLPQMADLIMERIGSIVEIGYGETFEDLVSLPEGDHWFLSSLQPVRDSDGRIFAIQIVSQDNTDRKLVEEELERYRKNLEEMVEERTEKLATANEQLMEEIDERKRVEDALRQSEENLRALIENSPDFIVEVDREGRMLFLNRTVAGVTVEDLIGKCVYDLVEPEYSELGKRSIKNTFETGSTEAIEVSGLGPHETVSTYEARFDALKQDGETVAVMIIVTDITERKKAQETLQQSEKQFRSLIENASDVIMVLDANATIRYASPSAERLYGYDLKRLIGRNAFKFIHADDVTHVQQVFTRGIEIPDYTTSMELRIRHNDGSWRYIELTGRNLLDDPAVEGVVLNFRDITARKEAEEALKESEELYRLLADNVTDVIWIRDMDLLLTYISPSIIDLQGYTVQEAMSQPVEKIVTPESYEIIARTLAEELAMENLEEKDLSRSRTIEIEVYCKDGSTIWVEVKMTFLRDADNQAIGIIGVTRDISDRKRAEQALRESEERFRALIENSSDAIVIMDSKANINYYSPASERVLSVEPGESIVNSFDYIHPDDLTKAVRLFDNLAQNQGSIETSEVRISLDGDSWSTIEATGHNLLDDPAVRGIVVNFHDITERKQMEEEIRATAEKLFATFESMSDGVCITDRKGNLIDVNEAFYQMYGYDSKEEVIGKSALVFVAKSEHERVRTDITRTVKDHGRDTREYRMRMKDDSEFDVEISSSPLLDGSGKSVGTITVMRNISERKKTQEALKESEEKYRTLFEKSRASITLVDTTETVVDCNTATEELIGYSKNDVIGKQFGQLFTLNHEDIPNLTAIYEKLRNQQEAEPFDIEISNRDGEKLWINVITSLLMKNEELFGFQVIASDITEHKHAEEALRESDEIRREGLRGAILAQEEERRRIARELHDQTSQVLTGASAMLEVSIASLPRGFTEVKDRLTETRLSLTNMLVDVRNIIYELRPTMLDDLGLVAAARWQTEEFLGNAGIAAHFDTTGRKKKLPVQMETALFRIIQESTTNIIKHAQAGSARIRLGFEKDSVKLSIEDDGRGFDLQEIKNPKGRRRGLGLLSMKERAEILNGTFNIESQPGSGTRITIDIPI